MPSAPTIKQDIKINVIGLEEANRAIDILEKAAKLAGEVEKSSTKLAEAQKELIQLSASANDFAGKGGKKMQRRLKKLVEKFNDYAEALNKSEDKIKSFKKAQKELRRHAKLDEDPQASNQEVNKDIKNISQGQARAAGFFAARRKELAQATVELVAAEIAYREALEATQLAMKGQAAKDRALTRARNVNTEDGTPKRRPAAPRMPTSAAATNNLTEARSKLIPVTKAAMKAENDYRATMKATIKFLRANKIAEKELTAARKETQRLLQWMEKIQKKEAAAKKAQEQATQAQAKKESWLDRILRRKTKTVKRATRANKQNAASMGIQQRRAHALSGTIGALGGSMRNVATSILFHAKTGPIFALLAVVGAIRTVYSAVIRPAAEYDKMMAQVRKTTEMTARETDRFAKGLLDLSSRLGIAHGDLAKIAEVAGQMGIRGRSNLMQFTQTIAMMTQVTELGAEKAAAGIAAISEAFELPIEQAQKMGSVINELSNNTTANAGKIIQALGKIGPTAHNIGISLAEAAAMASTLIHSGFVAPRVGTTLRNVFSIIQSKAYIISKTLGMSMTDFNNELMDNALPVIQRYLKHINEMQASAVHLQQVFGRENVAQIRALAQLMNTSLAKNLDLANVAFDKGTSLIEEYGRGIDNLATKMDRHGVRMKNWAINLGLSMKEGLESVLGMLGEFTFPVPILEASRKTVANELTRLGELRNERTDEIRAELIAADPAGILDQKELQKAIKRDKTIRAIDRSVQRRLEDLNKLNDHIHQGNLMMGDLETMQKEFEIRKEALINSIEGTELEGKTVDELYVALEEFQEIQELHLQGRYPAAATGRYFSDMKKLENQILQIRDLEYDIITTLASRKKDEFPELKLPFNLENLPDDYKKYQIALRNYERHLGILSEGSDLFKLMNQVATNLKHLETLRGQHTDWDKKVDGKYVNLGGLAHIIPYEGADVWTKVHDDKTIEIINDTSHFWTELLEMIEKATAVQNKYYAQLAEYLELYERNARRVENLVEFGHQYNLPFFTPEGLEANAEQTMPFRMRHDYSPMDYFIPERMRKHEGWDYIGDYFVGGDVGGKEILETFQNRFDVRTALKWLEDEFKTAIKNLDDKNVLNENLIALFDLQDSNVIDKFAESLGVSAEELWERLNQELEMSEGTARGMLENIHPILQNMELWETMTYEAKEKVRNDLANFFETWFPDQTTEGKFLPGLQRAIEMGIKELDHWINEWNKKRDKIIKDFKKDVKEMDESIDNISRGMKDIVKLVDALSVGGKNLDKFVKTLIEGISAAGDLVEQMKKIKAEAEFVNAIGVIPEQWDESSMPDQISAVIRIATAVVNIGNIIFGFSQRAEKQREEAIKQAKENNKKLVESIESLRGPQTASGISGVDVTKGIDALKKYVLDVQSIIEEMPGTALSTGDWKAVQKKTEDLVDLLMDLGVIQSEGAKKALLARTQHSDPEKILQGARSILEEFMPILRRQGQFANTVDGLLASMRFLSEFMDMDVQTSFMHFMEGLETLEGVPEKIVQGISRLDLSREEDREKLLEMLSQWAFQISEGTFDFSESSISPEELRDLMNYLKGLATGEISEDSESDIATLSVSRSITDVQANAVILLLEQSVYWLKKIAGHIGVTGEFPGPQIAKPPNVATRDNGMNKKPQLSNYYVDVNGDIGVTVPYDPDDPLFADAVGQAVASKVRRYGVRR